MYFETIPLNLRLPGHFVEISTRRAMRGLPGMPSRLLYLGQRLNTGTVAAGAPTRVTRPADAVAFFGRGSMLAAMLTAGLKANKWTETWAIALDDLPGGTAATHTITFTGAATMAGTLPLYVDGVRVQVGIVNGADPTAAATATAAAINALPDLRSTATSALGVVTVTCRHKGLCGNGTDIRVGYYPDEVKPAGLTVAIAAGVAGAGNPDILDAIAAMGGMWFTGIICPWTDSTNLNLLETEMRARFGGMQMQDGRVYAAHSLTYGNATTFGLARNTGMETHMPAYRSPTPPYIWAAVYGAVAEFQLGIDPARPLQNVILPGVMAPSVADRYEDTERNQLLYSGMSTWFADDAGNVTLERCITAYRKNAANVDDTSLLDVETLATLAYLRYSQRVRLALRYPRHKLTDDGNDIAPGQATVRPKDIHAELVALASEWQRAGLVENVDQFAAELIVQRDPDVPDQVLILNPPNLINQLRRTKTLVEFTV